jgi:hypothetical protein
MVPLEFFIDLFLPPALLFWGQLASNRNEYQDYFLGIKTLGAQGWQPYHFHTLIVWKFGSINACKGNA